MSPARRKDDELVQQMYKYSKALTDMVATGWITRERLGRSHHLQMEVTMHLQVIGEAARLLRDRGADLGPSVPLLAMVRAKLCDFEARSASFAGTLDTSGQA